MINFLLMLLQAPQGGGTFQLVFLLIFLPLTIFLYKLFIRWAFKINEQIDLKTKQIKLLSLIAEKLGVEKSEIDEIIK